MRKENIIWKTTNNVKGRVNLGEPEIDARTEF
jgi:hypothetical protein